MTASYMHKVPRAIAIAAGVILFLAGCTTEGATSSTSSSGQGDSAPEQGYVSGDGSTTSIASSERTEPVEFDGVTDQDQHVTQDDYQGSVAVVNFWYAGCPPCRAEAPDLVSAYEEFNDRNVKFLGVNTRDGKSQAVAFANEYGIVYPSILDTLENRAVQRAFAAHTPLSAVPTTLILDSQGRVAHRIIGQIAGFSQLRTLIQETLDEELPEGSGTRQ